MTAGPARRNWAYSAGVQIVEPKHAACRAHSTGPLRSGGSGNPIIDLSSIITIFVAAIDGAGLADTGYVGAVTFATSDQFATVPSNFAFVPADRGVKVFINGGVLGTLGSQTITATDAAGVLAPGTLALTVTPGAPAVRLILSNDPCLIIPCPTQPPPPTTVPSGVHFGIYVLADSGIAPDPNYSGTVHFSSTDPLATLPPSYTFVSGDQGRKGFTAILRTPGPQTITVADPVNNLMPGTLTMSVTGQAVVNVPVLSDTTKLFLGSFLALCGFWLLRPNR